MDTWERIEVLRDVWLSLKSAKTTRNESNVRGWLNEIIGQIDNAVEAVEALEKEYSMAYALEVLANQQALEAEYWKSVL